MSNKNLTTRQINLLTRDGGNGQNVYLVSACQTFTARVIRSRTVKGQQQVRRLTDGKWLNVHPSDTFLVG